MSIVTQLKTKLFADGADKKGMLDMYQHPYIKGFTTNPTLMRKAGITDYQAFALDILQAIPDRSISFEVFVDDLDEMVEQANLIAAWGENVMVKIPVTNTQGEFTGRIIKQLSAAGIPLNITAILTLEQVRAIAACLSEKTAAIVSVFAGRIADTGVDPIPLMQDALKILQPLPKAELLWASPRELLNVVQANEIGCHIITATNDILNKLHLLGKDLADYSLDTVKMFYKDAQAAGYQIMPLEEAV
ncbi:MAG TPA: transaldolase [Gammaproteobacteria bacterium]|nr:transaldolase [Gammaproteobacteria bacterium]